MEYVKYPTITNNIIISSSGFLGSNFFSGGNTYLYILKGEVPTIAQIRAASYNTLIAPRTADVLIGYNLREITRTYGPSSLSLGQIPYTAAARSGVATWFAILAPSGYSQVLVGDISTAAGNGFLKLNDTNIVQGNTYKVMPMTFKMPTEYALG